MFIVIAREDTVNGQPGRYSQCTRRTFDTYREAYDYACGVSPSRGPYVLELPENGFGTCGVIHPVFGALYTSRDDSPFKEIAPGVHVPRKK